MNFLVKHHFKILLIFLSLFPILALLPSGFPITHDGQDHVARIANFYLNLEQGSLIPRWASNLNWGYGHPILMFLYPLPSYIASLFHFLGFSFVNSTKIVMGLGMFLSLPFMYLWLREFTSKYAALFGAVLFTYAPYRFVDLYVRGDVGENLAFPFIPLTLFFIYRLYKNQDLKYFILGSFSLSFLILSHNAISLILMPFILLYSLLLIYLSKYKKTLIINLVFLIILGLALSAFFWIPALLEGKYTLRDIVTAGTYINRFVNFEQLIYGPWSYGITGQFTLQFGPLSWISLLLSPLVLIFGKKDKYKFYLALILIAFSIFSIFIMLPVSNFIWSKIIILQNFQFPWRFLAMVLFTTSVLGALLLDSLNKKINVKLVSISAIIIILLISINYAKPKAYQEKSESFYTGIYESTTDTGESAPIWSVRFMEHRPSAHLEIIDGYAEIEEIERSSTYHKYQIKVDAKTLFRENTLYFPGWKITANNLPVEVYFQNKDYQGIMTFFLNKGSYETVARFEETKLRMISNIISLLSLISIFSLFIYSKVRKIK
ncbi:MAG: hypothetical protein A3B38_02155 [Candidatus Levybacteria bacterium RIFCSPLOWO2_01_FULL_36_13]|nr:MAG: hypothetical protein A2684_03390 [Candidatus Levybacteria bacterium RIFCSPHIGHO2_01_FULL_36_15b]OGH35666.1 MAG: hypothetical protein A3B38_02155 [Candidatus Levybacteria bacterium RIFCSPLOWO2_01_FULL_36_13]